MDYEEKYTNFLINLPKGCKTLLFMISWATVFIILGKGIISVLNMKGASEFLQTILFSGLLIILAIALLNIIILWNNPLEK